MKLYHFVLVFVVIAISVLVITDIQTNDLKAVLHNKEQYDRNLDTAIDDAATVLVQVDMNNKLMVNKDAAMESFLYSLYSSYGVLSDPEAREKLNLYIPVALVTMEDGYYIFYSDTYTSGDGYTYVAKRWSEKFPYYYEDSDFIYGFTLGDIVTLYDKNGLLDSSGNQSVFQLDYHELITKDAYKSFRSKRPNSFLLSEESFEEVRKGRLIALLEEGMAYYTSQHNRIARQYGITYNFSLPAVKEAQWEGYLDDISIFVVFQGYPYGDQVGETYNRFASAGAKISKNRVYYLEQKGWYLLYHKSTCLHLNEDGILFQDTPYYDIETCVKEGAYACPDCIDNGAYPPDYEP